MPPILIESIEITECMQGCTFSLLLFSSAPLTTVLAVALHSYQGKRHKSVAAQEQVYYSVEFLGSPTRWTVTRLPILIESIEVAVALHSSQGKQHKSAAAEEQVLN